MNVLLLLVLLQSGASSGAPGRCAPCHKVETEHFAGAGMTQALERGAGNRKLATKLGGYSYELDPPNLTVTDGAETLRVPVEWTFGQGTTGQTWLFEREGRWYESRVSYYGALKGLDITIGQQSITPHNLLEATGRLIPPTEARQCFSCHSTANTAGTTPGIQCERCHAGTAAHLANPAAVHARLGKLSTEEMSDFCGECHRRWSDISIKGPRGIQNVRFQPYRLANSKCYDASDARIRCTACHSPHEALNTNVSSYDAKCLACHGPSGKAICNVAKKDCATCHMPKLDLPGAHKSFTDHRIRIVRPNEAYPD